MLSDLLLRQSFVYRPTATWTAAEEQLVNEAQYKLISKAPGPYWIVALSVYLPTFNKDFIQSTKSVDKATLAL